MVVIFAVEDMRKPYEGGCDIREPSGPVIRRIMGAQDGLLRYFYSRYRSPSGSRETIAADNEK